MRIIKNTLRAASLPAIVMTFAIIAGVLFNWSNETIQSIWIFALIFFAMRIFEDSIARKVIRSLRDEGYIKVDQP